MTLADFGGGEYQYPTGLLEDSNGDFFGATEQGGLSNAGTVFEVQKGSGAITTLASFNGGNGANPLGTLIDDGGGSLVGTTSQGGSANDGTVFKVPKVGGAISTVASFTGINGDRPGAGLIEDNIGNLFGTTALGGPDYTGANSGFGTVFEVQTGSGAITTLASFNGANGAEPFGGLVEDSSGNLFGTTSEGGPAGYGTVFELQAGTGAITTLATFTGANGANPEAGLVRDTNGNLFGTTANGGGGGDGTVFEVQNGSGAITTLASFNGADGAGPESGLLEDGRGDLFGTALYGGVSYSGPSSGYGTVFEVSAGTNIIQNLAIFDNSNGTYPYGTLVEDSSGNLFGTTEGGGASSDGTVFDIPAPPPPVITTPNIAPWTVNQPGYSQTIDATGGIGTLTFSSGGTLPPGLSLSSTGVLSGTPTAAGVYSFTVTATDSAGTMGTENFTVTINPPVSINTSAAVIYNLAGDWSDTSNPNGPWSYNYDIGKPITVHQSSLDPTAFAAAQPAWAFAASPAPGSIPPWFLSNGTAFSDFDTPFGRVITHSNDGTPSNVTWTSPINGTIVITGDTWLARKTLGRSNDWSLTFNSATLASGTVTSNDSFTSSSPETFGSFTEAVHVGDVVTFLALKIPSSTGELEGVDLTINAMPATTLSSGEAAAPYTATITATGGTGPILFSSSGNLPTGLTLSASGILSGTPSMPGSYTFTVTATDTTGASVSQSYIVTINPAVTITTTTLPAWTVNQPGYSSQITATGGTGSITFSSSTPPPGLTFSGAGASFLPVDISNQANFSWATPFSFPGLPSGVYLPGAPTGMVSLGGISFNITSNASGLQAWNAEIAAGGAVGGTQSITIDPNVYGATDVYTLINTFGGQSGPSSYAELVFTGSSGATYTLNLVGNIDIRDYNNGGFTNSINGTTTINVFNDTDLGGLAGRLDMQRIVLPAAFATQTLTSIELVDTGGVTGGPGSFQRTILDGVTVKYTHAVATGLLSGTPNSAGAFNFTVTATDTTGVSASQTYSLTVNPQVSISTTTLSNWTVNEPGYNQTLSASGGTGTLTFSTTSGTMPAGLTLSSAGALSGTPKAAGSFNFTITATDALGATGSQSYTVIINPPLAITTITLPNWITKEPGYNQAISNIGGTGPLMFAVTSGMLPPGLTLSSAGVLSGEATVSGSYTFTLTAMDATNANASQSYTILVGPGPFSQYLLAEQGSSTVQAGNPFIVTVQAADQYGNQVTSYSGPTSVTATITPTSTASSFPTTVAINSSGFGFFLANLQKVGSYTISVSSSSFSGTSTPITVTPSPPAALAFSVQPVNTPTGDTLPPVSVEVVDAYGNVVTSDNSDSITLSVASGPGPFTASSTITATASNGVASFGNLILAVPGAYKLSAVLPEHYIVSSAAFTVLPLEVMPGSFAGTPSGFSFQFNAPFLVNSTTPVLYGTGYGATAPVPSVTLTQTQDATGHPVNNPVAGSLVLNTATNSITFLATNVTFEANNGSPLLPDGTYTMVIHSNAANNGFQALNFGGGFLDGLADGAPGSGDYTTTFTVNAAASGQDVIWVPEVAEGPGQVLNAPGMNRAGGGYPVYVDDNTGKVTSVQATMTYNPALLTVTPTTTTTFTVTVPTTGTALLQYSGPGLPVGSETPLGFITATVPSGTLSNPTPYKAKDLLHLSSVSINGGAVLVTTSDGLHLVAYVGDGDGNGSYSSNDAVLITRAAIQVDSGFTAYPLVDPVIVGNTDGEGFISADSALQANEASVGFPAYNLTTPAVPAGVHFRAIANNVDPTLSIPSNLQLGHDGTLTVPVNIDDAHPAGSTGLIRGQLALTYNPQQFTVSAADVHLGSVLTAGPGWTLQVNINPTTGEIGIVFSSTTPISSPVGGSLVTIDFHPIAGASGPPAIALVASINPTGQQVVMTELEDAQGTFTLTPAPTNGFESRIDSQVIQAAPTPAATEVEAFESVTINGAAPVGVQGVEARPVEVAQPDAATLNRAASGSGEEPTEPAGAAPEPVHPSAPHIAVTSFAFTVPNDAALAGPATALAIQYNPVIPPAEYTEVNRLADRFFQTLATQPPAPAASLLDSMMWDDVGDDLDFQGASAMVSVLAKCHEGNTTAPAVSALETPADASVQPTDDG